ncbi:MAG TPA: O-antigen ligase family protein [Thermoanaerobaculia bacterium]|nr:O-antigen ligase family protein [Thermoanaerobaculia bacterium]
MRHTILRHAIALDLVVIATGLVLLEPQVPASAIVAVYSVAVLIAAWLGGRTAGTTATIATLIVFGFLLEPAVATEHYVFFAAAGALLTLAVPAWRERGLDAAAVAPPPPARPRPPVPRWVEYALPVVLLMVYCDLSEVLIVAFGLPSLLQPLVVGLMFAIWLYRDALQPQRVLLHPVTLALTMYCAMLFITTAWADDLALADLRITRTSKAYFVYLVIAILASASWRSVRIALKTLGLAAAGLAGLSILQIAAGIHNEFGGLASLVHANIYEQELDTRAAGPVGDPNFYGQMLVMVIPLALYLAYTSREKWQRLIWIGAALTIMGGVLVSYSRGAMLALAVMTGLVLVSLRVPLTRVAMATAVAATVLLLLPGNIGNRFRTMLTLIPQETYYVPVDASFERRKLIAATGLHIFERNALIGVGAGNFATHYIEYARDIGSSAELFYRQGESDQPHSLYLETASETGLLGLSVFFTLLGVSYAQLRRTRRILLRGQARRDELIVLALTVALLAYLVTSIFLHGATHRYLFTIFAFITAVSSVAADEELRRPEPAAA